MSDVDRLRAAADRLDAVGALWGQWANVDPAFDRAAAALLRAVADDLEHDDSPWSFTREAAFALADTILGADE